MNNSSIEKYQHKMSSEELRCERLRNLIGPLWNFPEIIEAFLKKDKDLNIDSIRKMLDTIKRTKPMLKKAMNPNISKEELKKLYL